MTTQIKAYDLQNLLLALKTIFPNIIGDTTKRPPNPIYSVTFSASYSTTPEPGPAPITPEARTSSRALTRRALAPLVLTY